MAMIRASQLVEEHIKTIGKYTYDQRDCITSIWLILQQYGAKTQLVGSNWFARHELRNMRPLTHRFQFYDGCAVLKTLHPGQAGYDLPARYKNHVDLIDYNHIGLGTDDGRILDSTRYGKQPDGSWTRNGPGWSTAKIGPNSWDIIADFPPDMVDYSDRGQAPDYQPPEVIPMEYAQVYAESGSTVRLRKTASTKAIAITNVPIGAKVGVLDKQGPWWQITHAGKTGWMMAEFLKQGTSELNASPPDQFITLTIPSSAAQALFDALKSAL